jgi:hypothetical protein
MIIVSSAIIHLQSICFLKGNPSMNRINRVSLQIHLGMTYFSLAMSFAEESAKAFGMGETDILKLRLACEEIFMYLSESDQSGKDITIEAENGIYYVGMKFLFDGRTFDPHAFNITSKPSLDNETGIKEIGLIIASRSVDKFSMLFDAREGFGIGILKEKTYPESREVEIPSVKPLTKYVVKTPDSETLKLFARQVPLYYPRHLYPADFLYPGKMVDMVANGRYDALVAWDDRAGAAGGVIWRVAGTKTVQMFGPYLFNQPPEYGMAEELIDSLIMAVAKTDALCLLNVYSTPEVPRGYFELLGAINYILPDGQQQTWPFYYRQLKEDPGARVWAHLSLQPFLSEEYKRLAFARDIALTGHDGENRPDHAVISPRFDRTQNFVRLRAIWDGKDFSNILGEHVRLLKGEGLSNILFELDCAHAWQANLAPILMEHGFKPHIIFPYAGRADIVLFQYEERSE